MKRTLINMGDHTDRSHVNLLVKQRLTPLGHHIMRSANLSPLKARPKRTIHTPTNWRQTSRPENRHTRIVDTPQ
jgi:hypothetical protein